MIRRLFFLMILVSVQISTGQNSRMIIPSEISQNVIGEMQEMGLKLSARDIYNPDTNSLNDAVVQFNGGCTGEIVSSQGLILTNHHCGYGAIQSHSTFEHNYIKDGFWAKNFEEELPNPGMYVSFVRKIEDITTRVLSGITEDMDENIKQSVIQKNINQIKKKYPKKDWQEVEIKAFYNGNKYYAFVKETFKDIRLVGAPPSSIGKFGADTDNWMWPRHSGDFSIFRIYAGKNNKPAEYSPDNVPYQTDAYFNISLEPIRPGTFFIVYGFPGRTQEYLPAVAVEQKVNIINPARINTRETALNVMKAFMAKNDTIKLKYTAKFARIANYWKKWKGESQGINKTNAVQKKKEFENYFLSQVKEKKLDPTYLSIFDRFEDLYKKNKDIELARNYFIEIVYLNNDLLHRAFNLYRLQNIYESKGKETFKEKAEEYAQTVKGSFKNYDEKVDKELFKNLVRLYITQIPEKYLNPEIKNIDIDKLAGEIYKNSILNNQEELEKIHTKNPHKFNKTLNNDTGYQFAKLIIDDYYHKIAPDYIEIRDKINNLQKKYMKGIIEALDKLPYPDANGTLRISYGSVKGYQPRDAVYYHPVSHLQGVIEKYIPGDYEFDVPAELLELYEKKDYQPYSNTGFMPVNFLGTAHTTGGNSGSPAINKEGELIGINFDRVWEGTMSDLYYDQKISRNIMVDIKYVMFIIDKIGHAKRLINEMNLTK